MSATTWLIYGGCAIAGMGLGFVVLTQSSWYKMRLYPVKLKQLFDKYKIQEKAEALQAMGQNPNPMLVKKPLRELITAYQGLLQDLEAMKVPAKAKGLHEQTLAMHRESLSLYQMAAVGGFRQKSMLDKQKKLQQMERGITATMEQLYGKMKKPEELTGFQGWLARLMTKSQRQAKK